MKVLDLFCGAGGAAQGYVEAGFDVLGIDIEMQPNYPYDFMAADVFLALEYLDLEQFDLVHASPPCQGYSVHVTAEDSKWSKNRGKNEPRLIGPIRELIKSRPYVIENVLGAEDDMQDPIMLCGSMFDLKMPRHRLFETNFPVQQPHHPNCLSLIKKSSAELGWDRHVFTIAGKGGPGYTEKWKTLLGLDHGATQREMAEAIPPAFTYYIATEFMPRAFSTFTMSTSNKEI